MSKRTDDLQTQVDGLRAELLELSEVEAPSDEQVTRSADALAEYETADAELVKARAHDEKIELIRSAAANPANVEPSFAAPSITRERDPFENLDSIRAGHVDPEEVRQRAMDFLENDKTRGVSDDAKSTAYDLVERDESGNIARHAMLTGSPEYMTAFRKTLRSPMRPGLSEREDDLMRAALSTTAANGGVAIPFLLDPTVILTNAGTANPFRQISRIVKGTSNKWNGVTSAGVTAEWKTEGSQAADASPTFVQPVITAFQADAYVFGSYEVFEDTNLASELPGLIADAKDRIESDAFAIGSGSAAPFGVVTSTTAITASRVSPTTGGTFTSASIADVYRTTAALDPRHRAKSTHVANYAVYNLIRQMSSGGAGSAFWANFGSNVPEQLLGRPLYESSTMASSMTTGSNILLTGNFENYVIFDRIGMTIEYIPNVVGANFRPTGQRGWFATWRVGADVTDANAFRVLKL